MKISWKWLSELVDLNKVGGPQGLSDLLTSRGLEVEAIDRQDLGLEKVISVQILERNKHPEADRLSLCKVDTGAASGPGSKDSPLEIVCGAQNMKAGDKVCLAQIGAELPNGLKIALSKIRGVTSNGMLCSEEELKLPRVNDKAEGILILPQDTPIGKPLAEILGRDDVILSFKLTANRGDCLSHWGMAREVAAALGQVPKRPKAADLKFDANSPKTPIAIELNAGENAPQFYGCSIEGVKVGPSPAWVVQKLEALGSRSINNVVDASNLLMFELGQPVHIYDSTKIGGQRIQVRMGEAGEKLPLLDGTEVTLAGTELVIADGAQGKGHAIGLAGVMGGGNSEVQPQTTTVFLECAEFSPSLVRKASSKHQKKTDAAHRFERGIDPQGQAFAIARLAELVVRLAGGTIKGASAVRMASREKFVPKKVSVKPSYFSKFLGMKVSLEESEKVLIALECKVEKSSNESSDVSGVTWDVTVPSYRLDMSIPEDLAEEIARSLGYDRIEETVPTLTSAPTSIAAESAWAQLKLLDRAKDALHEAGVQETVNFSFTSQQWLSQLGLTSSGKLMNPLSEEYETLVPSLLPGLIKNAVDSTRKHFGSEPLPIRLFEIRPTFSAPVEVRAQGEMETGVQENWKLSFVLSGPRYAEALRAEQGEVDFYDVRAVFDKILTGLGVRGARTQPMGAFAGLKPGQENRKTAHLFHPGKTVEVLAGKDLAGYFGLMHPAYSRGLKLRSPLWLAELDWTMLRKLARPVTQSQAFKGWSEFPPIERDFALLVKNDVSADKITQVALKAGRPLAKIAKVFDIYRGSQVQEGMTSVAVRVIFYEESRSLQESEAETASAQILAAWKKDLSAELRG
jgi:phenylalanyl-tRNA synthetase beta chain